MKDLSNITLARLIMSRLWQVYDGGGISMHRTMRSSFLEHSMTLIPLNDQGRDISLDVLIAEAEKREIPTDPIFSAELITDISLLSHEQYLVIALMELGKWYAQNPLVPVDKETYVSLAEKTTYDSFVRLLRVRQGAAELQALGISFTPEEILREGWRRNRAMAERSCPLPVLL